MRGTLRTSFLLAILFLNACADATRDNPVDPANATLIQMEDPEVVGGRVSIRWRYWDDGSSAVSFRVRKAPSPGDEIDIQLAVGTSPALEEAQVTTVTTVPLERDGSPGWRSASIVDTVLAVGVRVLYEVAALDAGGTTTASETRPFFEAGTRFELVWPDPDEIEVRFTWSNASAETGGFRVERFAPDGSLEVVYTTDDPTVRTFADDDIAGNTPYAYRLITILRSGQEQLSEEITVGRYQLGSTRDIEPGASADRRSLLGGFGNVAHLVSVEPNRISWASSSGNASDVNNRDVLPWTDYRLDSVSAFLPASSFGRVIAGIRSDGSESFVTAWQDTVLTHVMSWPASGGERTGVRPFFGELLFYEGESIRLLGPELDVLEEVTIPFGEPVALMYGLQTETIWLAYPDRLYRGVAGATTWAEAEPWTEVPLPPGITLTAAAVTARHVAILDASTSRLHLIDETGTVRLSWDAPGVGLERGAIRWQLDEREHNPSYGVLLLADGAGTVFYFVSDGPDFNLGF